MSNRAEQLAALLPNVTPCTGCGASIRYNEAAPGSRAIYHPAPVCEHLRSKLRTMGMPEPAVSDGFLMLDGADEAGPQ
jgi:hypothetical protein